MNEITPSESVSSEAPVTQPAPPEEPVFRSTFELTELERVIAQRAGLNPDDYIAFTVPFQFNTRLGITVQEPAQVGGVPVVMAHFVAALDARAFVYSKVVGPGGTAARSPLDGLLVQPEGRLIVPQTNITKWGAEQIAQFVKEERRMFRLINRLTARVPGLAGAEPAPEGEAPPLPELGGEGRESVVIFARDPSENPERYAVKPPVHPAQAEVDRLADYLLAQWPNALSEGSAVDVAIRLLEMVHALAQADGATRAEAAYRRYGDAVEWKNHVGMAMPQWGDLPPHIRRAWIAAVREELPDTSGTPAHPAGAREEVLP